MSTQINANLQLVLNGQMLGGAIVGTSPQFNFAFAPLINYALTNGSGAANKINQGVFYSGTLVTNSNTTLNINTLASVGSLDPVGGTPALGVVKVFFLLHQGVTIGSPLETDTLTLEPGGTNPWLSLIGSGSTVILNGGAFIMAGDNGSAGWAVTASTAMNIKLVSGASNSGTTNFQLILLGTT